MQKTKSNRLARGQITSSHVKQLNKLYTKGTAAFGSIANLKKASGLPRSKVVQYLQSKAPYTKYRQFRKTFPRLKAVAYRINEIWSAFAERNIRSLKNIIHKYLEENWTWTYIKQLPQFVNIVNSRVNRVTQLAPNETFKKHEPFLISLAISTKKYKLKHEEGDLVRIAKPDEIFRKG